MMMSFYCISVDGYVRAYTNLRNICDQLHLKAPGRITSVAMRKYTATLSQVKIY